MSDDPERLDPSDSERPADERPSSEPSSADSDPSEPVDEGGSSDTDAHRPRRRAVLAAALVGLIVLVAGIGWFSGWFGIPPNAAVVAGERTIKKGDVDRWIKIARKTASGPNIVFDGPKYARCAKSYRRTAKTAGSNVSLAEARKQCRIADAQARDSAIGFLVSSAWLEQELEDRGERVSDAEVKRSYDDRRKSAYSDDREFRKFLSETGQKVADLKYRTRVELLSNRLRDGVFADIKRRYAPSEKEIADYYRKRRSTFRVGRSYTLDAVVSPSRRRASDALDALRRGDEIASVARRYSTERTAPKPVTVRSEDTEYPLLTKLEKADRGDTVGIVRGRDGWYVARVKGVEPPRTLSRKEATPKIREALLLNRQAAESNTYILDFQRRWKSRTDCREEYTIPYCKGGSEIPTAQPTGR